MYDLRPAAHTLAALVAETDDAQLDRATPCPDYTVGDLLDHIGGLAAAFASAARKENGVNATQPPPGDRAHLGGDWRMRIPRDLAALGDAWTTPSAWEGMTKIAGMDMPAEVVGTVGLDEVVTHGWDLARATDRPFDVDDSSIEGCLAFLEPLAQPEAAAMREPVFGPVVSARDDASPLDRVIALTGRDPDWTSKTAQGR
jgi:uncharacterized protein (TIGR03086 family)